MLDKNYLSKTRSGLMVYISLTNVALQMKEFSLELQGKKKFICNQDREVQGIVLTMKFNLTWINKDEFRYYLTLISIEKILILLTILCELAIKPKRKI